MNSRRISLCLDPALLESVYNMWDHLADFETARTEEGIHYILGELCRLVDGYNAIWFGSVRLDNMPDDPLAGWRPYCTYYLNASQPITQAVKEQTDRLEEGEVDSTTIANIAEAGTFRANRLCDLAPESWFQSEYYRKHYIGAGSADAVWVAFPLNEDAESWFGIFRPVGAPPFSAEDRDALAFALRGIKWFHRELMLGHGLVVAGTPLTASERKVLHFMLSGASEKVIGDELGLTPNTTHQYVVAIYRKFGVRSRAALMSLWLGQRC